MLIHVGYDLQFALPAPTEVFFALSIHPSRSASLRKPESLQIEPNIPYASYLDPFGNLCGRAALPAGSVRFTNDAVVDDSGQPDPEDRSAAQWPVNQLPPEALQFLLPSRYCEVDGELLPLAWALFGYTAPGWNRVQAICDFVHAHLRFDYNLARSTRTALEAYREKVGVCRDFMHLAITFCRCMNIPARYATGYLGDIGVPPVPFPMDFSAWFEVFLGGRWWTFDARHNQRRIGRVLMATGRDAADVALTTMFGQHQILKFAVWTEELSEIQHHSHPGQSSQMAV